MSAGRGRWLLIWLVALFAAVALLVLRSRGAFGTQEPWLAALEAQVKAEQGCDLAHIVSQRELRLGDGTRLEGRLRCVDGREYDFGRDKPHLKFQVRLCQPVYC